MNLPFQDDEMKRNMVKVHGGRRTYVTTEEGFAIFCFLYSKREGWFQEQ